MYLPRTLNHVFQQALLSFPALLITGPRQSGKTIFLQHTMGSAAAYVSFDDPMMRAFALSDPNGFLDQYQAETVILDEIQYAPELLPYIKIRIDRNAEIYGNRKKLSIWVQIKASFCARSRRPITSTCSLRG